MVQYCKQYFRVYCTVPKPIGHRANPAAPPPASPRLDFGPLADGEMGTGLEGGTGGSSHKPPTQHNRPLLHRWPSLVSSTAKIALYFGSISTVWQHYISRQSSIKYLSLHEIDPNLNNKTFPGSHPLSVSSRIKQSNMTSVTETRPALQLDGESLDMERLVQFSSGKFSLELTPAAWARVAKSRQVVQNILDSGEVACE